VLSPILEGAPAIRRKVSSENEGDKGSKSCDGTISATSTFDRTVSDEGTKVPSRSSTMVLRTTFDTGANECDPADHLIIKPAMNLIPPSFKNEMAIAVDELEPYERDM
jgi:hypothetical protein